MSVGGFVDEDQQNNADTDAADDRQGDHACGQYDARADGSEQERDVQRILDGSPEADDGQGAHHTQGQNDVGSHGENDDGRDHGQGDQGGAETGGIHDAPVGFLVDEKDKQANAKGQHNGQKHVKETDGRDVFQKAGFENVIKSHS